MNTFHLVVGEEIESLLEDIRHAVMDWETMKSSGLNC